MINTSPYLQCPVCCEPLSTSVDEKGLCCKNRHMFDRAKQGYHNLLLSQQKKSKHPGDTLEMVNARREFLDKGYYQSLAQKFVSLAISLATNKSKGTFNYCDLACGEGYYTNLLHDALSSHFQPVYSCGIDISTPAVKSACRRQKSINWLVGSAAKIPLEERSQDLVSGLFFHFDLTEISRVLRPGGHLILVNTGPKHLLEMREIIYEELKPESQIKFDQLPEGLEQVDTRNFSQIINLESGVDIQHLLSMTPHYWRCKPEKKLLLESLDELELQLDIQFDIFQKR